MRSFTPPPITTKGNVGQVKLAYAFRVDASFDPAHRFATLRGGRMYQEITGGVVSGPRLNGQVYPDSGGDYDFLRPDGVSDLNARFMIRAEDGEWIYVSHAGYRRPDGYYRIQASFDADAQGPYAWLNDAVVIGRGEPSPDSRRILFSYFEAL